MKLIFILLVILSSFFSGCNSEEPIDKEKIAHLYVDILASQEAYKFNNDSLKIVIDSLHNHYQLTKEQYMIELDKFKFDEQTWDEFFLLAEEYLDTLKAIEERRLAELKEKKSDQDKLN